MNRLKKQKLRWRICFCISSYHAFWHFPAKTLKSNSNIFLGLKRRPIFCMSWKDIQFLARTEKTSNFWQGLKRRPIFVIHWKYILFFTWTEKTSSFLHDWKHVRHFARIEKTGNFFKGLERRPIFVSFIRFLCSYSYATSAAVSSSYPWVLNMGFELEGTVHQYVNYIVQPKINLPMLK